MITSVQLSNFLAFASQKIDLANLTILTGTNSAGKSSIIRALAMLRQSHDAGILEDSWMLNGDLVQLGIGRDVLFAEPVAVGNRGGFALEVGLIDTDVEASWMAIFNAESDVLESIDQRPTSRQELASFSNVFQYLSADRITPSVTYPKSHEAAFVRRSLGARGEHTANFLRVWASSPIANKECAHPAALSAGYVDQANAWLTQISVGSAFSVSDVPGTDFVSLRFDRQGAEVRTDLQRATNVGFGLTFALPVIVGCLAAEPGSLLIVENPEAHLHPAGQALLGTLLARAASGGAQVIVETHSDHVLNAVRLAVKQGILSPERALFQFFSRQVGVLQPTVATLRVGDDGSIPNWPDGFFDQWDRALTELLS